MIRDRYDPVDLFTQIPKLCLQFEPVLAHLDRLLEDDALFAAVKADLARRAPKSLSRGRGSTPAPSGSARCRRASTGSATCTSRC